MVRFMGHYMASDVAAVNQRTLANAGANLYDVSRIDASFTKAQVLAMISSYSLPNVAYYNNDPASAEVQAQILAYRNVEALQQTQDQPVAIRYAITVSNAYLKCFPTFIKGNNDPNDARSFDYFLETAFAPGSGLLVLHETADRQWAFVQGENYYGWVYEGELAFTDKETYLSYINADDFLICTHPAEDYRLGEILPYTKKSGSVYTVSYPVRNGDGTLALTERVIDINSSAAAFSDGFLPFSEGLLLEKAYYLSDLSYGWSDDHGNYDCSSTVGLLYRLFGYYLPRNTSIMKYFGGSVTDLSGVAYRSGLIEAHPGALLVMPGHVVMYTGLTSQGHMVFHNTTYNGYYHVIINPLEEMQNGSGAAWIDCFTYLISVN